MREATPSKPLRSLSAPSPLFAAGAAGGLGLAAAPAIQKLSLGRTRRGVWESIFRPVCGAQAR